MAIRGIETSANALREALEGQVNAASRAAPGQVYAALADLRKHIEWAGKRQPRKMRLLSMDAPRGLAKTGTEFSSTGLNPNGTFSDHSVVTEATPGRAFEFVTESVLTPKGGAQPVEWTLVHRYEIAPGAKGGSTVSYRYRITRISHLIGPLRLLRTPMAFVVRRMWSMVTGKGLRNLIAVAEER